MAKAVNKKGKSRKLKRSIRKTLGALFLASALAVAAVPTEGLQAVDMEARLTTATYTDPGVTISDIFLPLGYVPKVEDGATIYTTGDGKFQFAYVSPETGKDDGSNNRVAVILGYNGLGMLEGGALTIPDEVEAYKKYAFGSTTGEYAAVNLDGDYLYYMRRVEKLDEDGRIVYQRAESSEDKKDDEGYKLDENGKRIPETVPKYNPCYYADRSTWVGDEILYVSKTDTGSGETVYEVSTRERISAAMVAYIGSQKLVQNPDGTWSLNGTVDNKSDGIFYGQGNIQSLTIGQNIMGIGNYAFASCAGLNSITLNNGLTVLGNSTFEDCVNLSAVKIDPGARLSIIGSRCFYNCQKLKSFDLPYSTQQIGNEAFADCTSLETVNLISTAKDENGELMNGLLNTIGNGIFRGCSSLKCVVFPSTFDNLGKGVDVSEFQDCVSLQYIKTDGNTTFDLKEGGCNAFKFEQFKEMVPATFYLEGPKIAALHTTATNNRIAYRFWDSGLEKFVYELIVAEADGKEAKYWVDDNNQLVGCEMEEGMSTVTLPENIGPQHISSIGSQTFQNNCALKIITIPASVTSIAENAFKGCHHLEDVIFTQAENVKSIGAGAFSTQDNTLHKPSPICNGQVDRESYLNFTGTISSTCVPFNYAMNPSEYINNQSQNRTYITYYSGWPTNLEVRYNETTGLNELIDYPTLKDLLAANKYVEKNDTNPDGYAYMTSDLVSAAQTAASNYLNGSSMSEYERQIVNAVLNLELPDGIESIATVDEYGERVEDVDSVSEADKDKLKGLFTYKEGLEYSDHESVRKTLKTEGLMEINASAFKDCNTLTGVTFNGPLKSIGDYAFDSCENLSSVSISEATSEMGLRPFTNCPGVSNVNFNGSEHFSCDNSIIFGLDANGNKYSLIEYLCGRRIPTIEAEELAGVKELYPEAFMDTGVMTVDLSDSGITDVPENAFRETLQLFSVKLPSTCQSISDHAFTDSSLFQITIPSSVRVITNDAFGNVRTDGDYAGKTDLGRLIFETPEDSVAAIFANKNGITRKDITEIVYHKILFWDHTGKELLGTLDKWAEGTAVKDDDLPFEKGILEREGYIFTGWFPSVTILVTPDMGDPINAQAQYDPIDPETLKVTVIFMDDDQTTEIRREETTIGGSVRIPRDPSREGYIFTGWLGAKVEDDEIKNVQQDMTVYAQYEKLDSTSTHHLVRFLDWDEETVLALRRVEDGKDVPSSDYPRDPVREGYTFDRWIPTPINVTRDMDVIAAYIQGSGNPNDPNNPSGSGNGTTSSNGSGSGSGSGSGNGTTSSNGSGTGATSKFYTLTVQNGSGSGSYVAGSQPIVIANDPSSTQEFSHWTIDPADTTIASKVLSATVITMPEENVTVTAHYRARTGSTTGSGNTSSANAGGRPNNSGTISNGGTTVVIDKNGISNTGVVAATVNGSSDNFVIKITESSEATEAVVRALMAEYGNLDNIKYFPMDISLYDSTGTKKITDTTGLSVSITLPLPDSLITYAGNNKVAGVVNDRLDKLTPKFTTISGVSCITFTAEHFSPYVIYVDTANLSAGGSADSTPKTGDGIHPKWFLSIGLACLSFVMFMQKDKRKPQKVKVKVKSN